MKCRVIQIVLVVGVAAFSFGQPVGPGGAGGGPGAGIQSAAAEITKDGFHLYNISVFGGYSSTADPFAESLAPQQGNLGPDEDYGASFNVGWQHHRDKDNFSINYTGSYSAMAKYSSANYYSEFLVLSMDRKLAPKWHANLSGSAQDATLLQVINQPTALSVVSQLPQDVQDLAAALGLGGFSTDQAASSILGAPVVQTPLRSLLLGDKIQSYSGTAGISYSYSPSLSFSLSGFGSGGRNRSANIDGSGTFLVLPHSFGANAAMSWSFSRSPRNEFAINLSGSRLENSYQQAMTGTATVSAGRRMGERWFAKVYGGGTYTDSIEQQAGRPKSEQFIGGGSLGFKLRAQTFAGTYDRSVSDNFGAFIGTYTTASGSWSWHRPGSRMSVQLGGGQQQVRNTGFESFSGWQASAGFTERLSPNLNMSTQYVYFKSTGAFQGQQSDFSVHSVRLTIGWAPEGLLR